MAAYRHRAVLGIVRPFIMRDVFFFWGCKQEIFSGFRVSFCTVNEINRAGSSRNESDYFRRGTQISFPLLESRSCENFWLRAGSSIKPQISSATNAACISNSNVTYLVSCWPQWTVEEDDIASFFVADLGLELAPKKCPDQFQTFNEVHNN